MQNHGVEDILIASVDGLSSFPQAINSIFPPNPSTIVYRVLNTELIKTNENSLMKLLYMGIVNASKKWTMQLRIGH